MNITDENILIRPIITERSTGNQAYGKYTFQVHRDANKVQIRKAIEKLFKVHVTKVNTITMRGKMRRFGKGAGKTPDWKKVIITLKPGDRIIIKGIESFEE